MKFLQFLNESLDSSYNIIKHEKGIYDVDLYYLDMEKSYRIFIEESDSILHIGFEREINGKWDISSRTNDLSKKEILGLFGTILKILRTRKFKGIWVTTDDPKKYQLYFNLMSKLNKELKMKQMRDESSIMLLSDYEINLNKSKFKYKREAK